MKFDKFMMQVLHKLIFAPLFWLFVISVITSSHFFFLFQRQRDREENLLVISLLPKMPTPAVAGPAWSQEPQTHFRLSRWMAGIQTAWAIGCCLSGCWKREWSQHLSLGILIGDGDNLGSIFIAALNVHPSCLVGKLILIWHSNI